MKHIDIEIISTTRQIADLVDWLYYLHAPLVLHSPIMYIDLEGVELSREGSISILTLLIDTGKPTRHIRLIDVHTLGAHAFQTASATWDTLKDILQDAKFPKVFFDVRNDSDALFAHFGVALQGVEDVQLMESATRKTTASRRFLNGLAKCIENKTLVSLNRSERANWKLAKERGERLFKAEHGGSHTIFNKRPIPEEIVSYCVGDVQYLPELRDRLWTGQTYQWRDLVREESKKRVAESQSLDYQPHGRDRAMAPWSKEQNITLDHWNYVPPASTYKDDLFSLCDDEDDEDDEDGSYDWYGDATTCRDCIDDCDYHFYYDD